MNFADTAVHRTSGIKLRLIYWFSFIALGAGTPFLNLYYKHVLTYNDNKPSLIAIGLIAFIQPLLGIISGPLTGIIADKYKAGSRLLFLCACASGIGSCFISLPGFVIFTGWSLTTRSLIIGAGIIVSGLFLGPIVPMINTETLNFLRRSGNDTRKYGSFRLMGSLAWILITLLIGLLLNITGIINLAPIIGFIGFFILALLSVIGFESKVEKVKISWEYIKNDKIYWLFLIFSFIQSFGLSNAFNFTSYFMDDAKLDYFIIGFSFAVSAILEVPVMYFSRSIIKKIGGSNMILIGTGFLTLKVLLLALLVPLKSPVLTLFAMSIHGIGYGLQFNGMIHFIDRLSHKDLRSTYMNLFGVVSTSISSSLGGVFSAFIIKLTNSTWMMYINAGIAVISIFYFLIFMKKGEMAHVQR
jgi:MFS family permease